MNTSLNWQEARIPPCQGCSADCCTVLPLRDFSIQSLSEVDWALYMLNFEGIEVSVLGEAWQVSIHLPCRNLDENRRCRVHQSAAQPEVCKRFSPYTCSYRRIYQQNDVRASLRINRERMLHYAGMLRFNENREIIEKPDFEQLCEELSQIPLPPPTPAWDDEPWDGRDLWEQTLRQGRVFPARTPQNWQEARQPCNDCAAWCCTRLFIPFATPANRQNIDYIYFLLGFPGLEVGLNTDGSWTVVVRSRCRHLQRSPEGAGRCGLMGHPDRPHVCTYYDASGCAYREHFARPQPRTMVRVRYEDFPVMAQLFQFDPEGYITTAPDASQLKQALVDAYQRDRSC